MNLNNEQLLFVVYVILPAIIITMLQLIKPSIKRKIGKIDKFVYEHVKNKVARETILSAIIEAQRKLASKPGKTRFKYAKNTILSKYPLLRIYHVDTLIQDIYNEFINANLTDNK